MTDITFGNVCSPDPENTIIKKHQQLKTLMT